MNMSVIESWVLLALVLFGLFLLVLLTLRALDNTPGRLNTRRAKLLRQAVTYAGEDIRYFPSIESPALFMAGKREFETAVTLSLACFPEKWARDAYLVALKRHIERSGVQVTGL